MISSDFPPSDIIELEKRRQTFWSFRPLLSYASVAKTVVNSFRNQHGAF